MKTTEILQDIEKVRETTRELAATVSPDLLDFRPGPDRWSLLMIIEHLALVEESVAAVTGRLAKRAAQADAGPCPEDIDIRPELLDYEGRVMDFPVFRNAVPDDAPSSDWRARLTGVRRNLEEAARSVLAVDCRERRLPHPVAGPLDAYEWLMFVALHERGHQDQIRRLLADLPRN